MRVYKPTYSKPLPEGAKTFTCKRGKDEGKQFAKFKDSRGHVTQARLTKSGDKILCETSHWHISFEDNLGIRRQLKAYSNERATERLADKVEDLLSCKANNQQPDDELSKWLEQVPAAIRNELIRFGLLDPERAAIGKALSEHVQEYKDHLGRKERSEAYVKEVGGTLSRIFADCGFATWSDISAAKLKDYLDGLRDGGKGISKRRYNGLLGAVKSFCRWMVKQQKASSSPIEYLDSLDNQQTDPRHRRRVLELNDFRRLLEAALTGPKIYGLSGRQRNLIYRLAAETGLRSCDIRRLRKRDFDFKEQKIAIKAGRIKNRQDAVVFLKPATAVEIEQYCANKLPHAQVFHLTDKTSLMVQFDLRNANIPYCENGLYYDFHSLRHQSASLYGMNPETPEAVRQKLMRHKSPEMTRHYTHAAEEQQRKAINDLPDLTQPSKESQAAVKTGTDDRNFLSKSCFEGAPIRSNTEASGKENLDSVQKTQLSANNEGAVRTVDPKVEGSSPFGLAS
jgi:integrase